MNASSPIWTFLPGLHGTSDLFNALRAHLPSDVDAEFVELPTTGKQSYEELSAWLDQHLPPARPRILIAESFSGPLAMHFAALRRNECAGIVLAASFCDTPINPGLGLLPLRPLFMVKPTRNTLKHFLIGDDASDLQIAELRATIKKIPATTLAKRVRSILNLEEGDTPSIPYLPMLILQAQNDNLVPWKAQSRLISNYPKSSVHWVEAPHLILQREPAECLAHIRQFAAQIQATHSA